MGYLSLLISLIFFIIIACILTYFGGIGGGLIGCILISLYNTWAANLILAHHFRTGVIIFLQNIVVTVPIMFSIDVLFTSLKQGLGITWTFYIYVLTSFLIIMTLYHWRDIKAFNLSELIKKQRQINQTRKIRAQQENASDRWKWDMQDLESAYTDVEKDPKSLTNFFKTTNKILNRTSQPKNYAPIMAFYFSKLILKGVELDNKEFAQTVFSYYLDKIFPATGSDNYKTNIIGNSLALAIRYADISISDRVFTTLLTPGFDVQQIDNALVLYNLACFYAVNHQKSEMLAAIHQGIYHGRDIKKYQEDLDFAGYWNDPDFLRVLQTSQPAMH